MSVAITILDNDDMPCNDWEQEEPCPMKKKWHEGEVRMCLECGWKIGYNCTE